MGLRRRLLIGLLLACAGWLVLHELRVVALGGFDFPPLSSRFAHDVVLLLAAGVCLARGILVRRERAAWLLIGAGVTAWTFGELYYTAVLWTETDPPIPSPADIGYLLFPVLMLAGMVILVRARARLSPALLVDGVAAALAVASLSAAIVFQAVLEEVEGDFVNVATEPRLSAHRLRPARGRRRRAGRHRLAPGPHLGAARRRHPRLLVRGLDVPRTHRAGRLRGRRLVRRRLVGRPDADRRRRVADAADAPARRTGDSLRLLIAPLVSGAVGLELLVYASMGDLNPLAVGLAAAALVFVMIRLTLTFRQNVGILRASRDEALTDALTGLGNRRALTRELDDALPAAQPESPLVLALFDLDGFKHYNDTFGHPAGDVLLARLGGNLRAYFGNRARVFRMGGDEFCALFEPRGADPTVLLDGAALALSEQGDGFWIGCSYGAVTLPREATDSAEALRIADQRMYAQKHAGRMSAGRQVKETLVAALAVRDPRFEAEARALSDVADAAARTLGLNRDERETVRLAAELHQVGRLVATRPEDVAVASERIVSAAPALTSVARLLRALNQNDAPVGAQIVAAVAEHRLDRSDPRFDPAVIEAVLAAQPALV